MPRKMRPPPNEKALVQVQAGTPFTYKVWLPAALRTQATWYHNPIARLYPTLMPRSSPFVSARVHVPVLQLPPGQGKRTPKPWPFIFWAIRSSEPGLAAVETDSSVVKVPAGGALALTHISRVNADVLKAVAFTREVDAAAASLSTMLPGTMHSEALREAEVETDYRRRRGRTRQDSCGRGRHRCAWR
jgi:hypothetical protein